MSISDNLNKLKSEIPGEVSIIAVSKRKPVSDILEAYEAGHRIFGENRVQELIEKQPKLPPDIKWHMVGHLQTNKVKYIAGFVDCIQSVDSMKLLNTIDREAEKAGRKISCLLQLHIAEEESKFGLGREELIELVSRDEFRLLRNISITGLMGMATFTSDTDQLRAEFRNLKDVFTELRQGEYAGDEGFREISMGMSGDYRLAIEEGSTMIRLGTSIFGPRT